VTMMALDGTILTYLLQALSETNVVRKE